MLVAKPIMRMRRTSPIDIERIADYPTQTAVILGAQHVLALRIAQGACPVCPVEE